MSNASLKEQLQAVASQLNVAEKKVSSNKPAKNPQPPRTATLPAKPKPKWLDYVQYGVALLRLCFPKAFLQGNQVKPLKKGIKDDLLRRLSEMDKIATDDKACMMKSLSYYVNTLNYHKSMLEGANRIDLDGLPAGNVTPEEATYSAERCQAKLAAKQGMQTEK